MRWRACGRRRPRSNTGGECHRDLSPRVMLVAAARTDCGGRLRRITKRTMLATFKGKSKQEEAHAGELAGPVHAAGGVGEGEEDGQRGDGAGDGWGA